VSKSNPAAKEGEFVSEIAQKAPAFFALYDEGRIAAGQIHDYIGAWHDSGDEETRPLSEYLGMTAEEFSVWVITSRALPVIAAARRANRPLREFVAPFFEQLKTANNPADKPVLHAMGYWLQQHPPGD
jgi:hypothetical protein